MSKRLENIPIYEFKKGEIAGHYYNHVQIALKRIGKEIRLTIPGLKHLDLILDDTAWIIVDRVHADVPIAAWTEFQAQQRDNLHQPVKCNIQLYHAAAHLILERTLDAMEELIDEELTHRYPADENKLLSFKPKN